MPRERRYVALRDRHDVAILDNYLARPVTDEKLPKRIRSEPFIPLSCDDQFVIEYRGYGFPRSDSKLDRLQLGPEALAPARVARHRL